MHLAWLLTAAFIFISFCDNGNVKGNNIELQVTQKLQEMTDLKEHLESLQKDIEWYISSFLNNNDLTKLNSMVRAFTQEKVHRINIEKKIESLEKAYGQQLKYLATTIENIDRHIENRLLAKTNATEVAFRSKLEETVSTIEQKCTGSMSKLNETLGKLYKQVNQRRVPKRVNGGWTAWGSWSNCSSTCVKGINNRVRTCTNPAPSNGGKYCDGVGMEFNECQISSCKVNGGWTAWGSWTSCTSTCGKGINHRVRTCTNPAPSNGGNYCDGVGMEFNECQIRSCKDNTSTAMPYCKHGWEEYQGSCYFFSHKSEDSISWRAAKEFCDRSNSHLLRIDNQMEFEFIRKVLLELHSKQLKDDITHVPGHWTGANDISNEGQWVWSPRDVQMRFTVWSEGEPNDQFGAEDCGELNRFIDFKMNDLNCNRERYFICETLQFR